MRLEMKLGSRLIISSILSQFQKFSSLLRVTSLPRSSQTWSIDGELTDAVKANLKGRPSFPKPIESSSTVCCKIFFKESNSQLSSSAR